MAYQLFSYKKTATPWYYPGKIRKRVLIFFGICLILSPILYFTAGFMIDLWYDSNLNPDRFDQQIIVNSTAIDQDNVLILPAEKISLSTGKSIFYTTINNKGNSVFGYNPLFIEILTLNQDKTVIDRETRETFLDPDEILYVSTLTDFEEATDIQINILPESRKTYIDYNNPKNPIQPGLEIYQKEIRTFEDFNKVDLLIGLYNPEAYDVQNIELSYILRIPATDDREAKIVGISQYYVSQIKARSTQEIRIEYPLNNILETPEVLDVRWRVNLYK